MVGVGASDVAVGTSTVGVGGFGVVVGGCAVAAGSSTVGVGGCVVLVGITSEVAVAGSGVDTKVGVAAVRPGVADGEDAAGVTPAISVGPEVRPHAAGRTTHRMPSRIRTGQGRIAVSA
jgi:hypothetical protein